MSGLLAASRSGTVVGRVIVTRRARLEGLTMAEILVDGNNVLHQDMPPELAGLERMQLCTLLGGLGSWDGKPIRRRCVFFDGKPERGQHKGTLEKVSFHFSGPGRSADDLIIEYVEASHHPKSLYVVTFDNEILAAIRRRGAKSIEPPRLVESLSRIATRQVTPHSRVSDRKPTGALSADEVEAEIRRQFEPKSRLG